MQIVLMSLKGANLKTNSTVDSTISRPDIFEHGLNLHPHSDHLTNKQAPTQALMFVLVLQ